MTVGALFILDTPSSLVEGGMLVEARQSLIKIRGNKSNVDDELAELVSSSELAKDDHEPLKTIFERVFFCRRQEEFLWRKWMRCGRSTGTGIDLSEGSCS
ncbi:hypothetical protein OIU78_012209 [Salix suchowensis]|nr:hypothetical protein OIU78_012209 [Salix suchowensis]